MLLLSKLAESALEITGIGAFLLEKLMKDVKISKIAATAIADRHRGRDLRHQIATCHA
jgi:hypothetical protein